MGQHGGAIPVTTSSIQFDSVDAGAFGVTHGRYPALASPPHSHLRNVCTVLLEGAWEEAIGRRTYDCTPGTMLAKPAGAVHVDRTAAGTRLLLVELDEPAVERLGGRADLLTHPSCLQDVSLLGIAWRIATELDSADSLTPVVVEGLTLELLGWAGRVSTTGFRSRPPLWLKRAQDLIHATFHTRVRVTEIAHQVDVHPVVLARGFRTHLSTSPGRYLRRVRLDWAAHEVTASARSLGEIALEAGFADQSHFTRAFRRRFGLTPRQYRLAFSRQRVV